MNKTAKTLAVTLMVLMAVCVLFSANAELINGSAPSSSPATNGNWIDNPDTSWYYDDDGQPLNLKEYEIDSAAQLAGLAEIVNKGTDGFNYETVTLTKSVDLSGKEWTPIGINPDESKNVFLGTFSAATDNGDGTYTYNTISNLTINDTEGKYTYAGLFGYLYGGAEHVKIDTVWIDAKKAAGALAGYMPGVSDVTSDIHVSNASVRSSGGNVGGIIGTVYGLKGSITGCSLSNSVITGESQHTGGIVGNIYKSTVKECKVTGSTITSTGPWAYGTSAGGIIGFAYSSETETTNISDCVVTDTDVLSDDASVGGILGQTRGQVSISDCSYTSSKLTGNYAGGIIGAVLGGTAGNANVTLSHTDNVDFTGNHIGGLVGYRNSDSSCTVSDSYVGTITADYESVDNLPRYAVPLGTETTNVTHWTVGSVNDWTDDGTRTPKVAHYTDGEFDYYYGSIADYCRDNTSATEVKLVNGAIFDEDLEIDIKLVLEDGDTAVVPADIKITFANNDYLPTAGTFTVNGIVELSAMPPSDTSFSFEGPGLIQIDGTTYGTDLKAPDYDISWYQGSETAETYEISDEADLRGLAFLVNEQGIRFENKTIELMADIHLTVAWTPIGHHVNLYSYKNVYEFDGTFDGNNHTIYNLNVDAPDQEGVGLFGSIYDGTIKDLTIENATVFGMNYVGAMVGWYGGSTAKDAVPQIVNCHVTGTIDIGGNYMVGGLVGRSAGGFDNCSVIGDGDGKIWTVPRDDISNGDGDNIGGLTSYVQQAGAEKAVVENCLVQGVNVTGSVKVGGMIGALNDSVDMIGNTVRDVTVTSNATPELIESESSKNTNSIGGLVGTTNSNGEDRVTFSGTKIQSVILEPLSGMQAGYIYGGARINDDVPSTEADTKDSIVGSDCSGATIITPGTVTTEHQVTFVVEGSVVHTEYVIDGEQVLYCPTPPSSYEWRVDGKAWNSRSPVYDSMIVTAEYSSNISDYPDDEFIPPIYVGEPASDNGTTIVACAAAAVVAALMAAFLIIDGRRR